MDGRPLDILIPFHINGVKMTESEAVWTDVAYTFDEIAHRFKVPQLVQVSEGYYAEEEGVPSFSAGDVIMLEQFVTLQKVSAKFVRELKDKIGAKSEYKILTDEILVPLDYEGKVKVHSEPKVYENVQELAKDFPRHAVVLETFKLSVKGAHSISLPAGTKIELDRIIPGSKTLKESLIICINTEKSIQLAMPMDTIGKFRSLPDDRQYTLKEVVDRYCLPKIVCFQDNKILSTYTQDLMKQVKEIEKITTPALQILNVIQQKVLIGHYREPDKIEEITSAGEKRRTTLVVVPLDSVDVNEVRLTVYKGGMSRSNCEKFFGKGIKTSKRRSMAMAQGLYREFAGKPRVIRFPDALFAELDESLGVKKAPPLPPKPVAKNLIHASSHATISQQSENLRKPNLPPLPDTPNSPKTSNENNPLGATHQSETPDTSNQSLNDYILPTNVMSVPPAVALPTIKRPKSPVSPRHYKREPSRTKSPTRLTSPEELTGQSYVNVSVSRDQDKNKTGGTLNKLFRSKKKTTKDKEAYKTVTVKKKTAAECLGVSKPDVANKRHINDEEHFYEEPDLEIIKTLKDTTPEDIERNLRADKSSNPQKVVNSSKNSVTEIPYVDMSWLKKQASKDDHSARQARPVAHIFPRSSSQPGLVKEFRLLSVDEVKQRLVTCGMPKLADFCFEEKINGAFLADMDKDTLSSLELSTFQQNKLKKIISGWIPT